MGKGRRRRSYSDSSESEADSESESSSSDGDEAGRCSDQEADNWVLCDRCTKWRRIPEGFAEQIQDDAPWYCEYNPNKAFASCSVPQELTNEEIDAAEDSDGAGENEHDEECLKRRRIPAVWQQLKDNVLAHRKRKVQDEDDIMICHCKPVYRGGDGCGPDCINRMLCIECVPGFCPTEEKCTNQMFSKRMYANLEIRRAGAKGFGLFALEDIKAGQFIIEYIGEVLEEDEYQRRKDYYMSVGQRHYYFMNIGNGEVIDACRKGNISRFINHSCEPNCETQKWLVRGELAIGLFAVRDIPKNTELTFDYNFERYGDKPMRCYCGSINCRKFIGGMQDNYDVSLLPAVEPDDASHDLPPIMLTDADMDPNMRMLLEWRVGAKMDKAKEMGMVTRLERLCKVRHVEWTAKHFYGQEPIPAPQQPEQAQRQQHQDRAAVVAASTASGRSMERQAGADLGTAPLSAQGKAKQQRKAEKVAADAAAAAAGKAKAVGAVTGKQVSEGGTQAAGLAKLRIEEGVGNTTPVGSVGQASGAAPQSARQTPATTPSFTPEVAQVRGPKALFKQWKIMQQQDTTPAPAVEEKPVITPSSPPSPRSQHSPPSPQSAPSPRSSLSLDNDDAALDELRNAATEAAKHVPIRKRLRRPLPLSVPKPTETPTQTAVTQNGSSTPLAVARKADSGGAVGVGSSGPACRTSSSGLGRKSSLGSAGAAAAVAAAPSYSPPRSTSPPPSFGGRAAGGRDSSRRLRSEIDRRLEEVVGNKGGIKDPSRQNIIKVLRMFNLCDIGSHPGRINGFGAAAGGRYLNGRNGDDAGPGPGSSAVLTARQRARMADLSLLLDVILKTTSVAAKKELVACGLLTQLHQAMGRNTGKEYCVILRKVLRAVEGLPLEANDVYAVRSAHGNFADMLKQLSNNADYDVRTKATALLKKFPPSAVTDQRLLQLMAAPPVRFGHGRGGMGGMRMGGYGGGMLPLAMQQQMLQQQQQLMQQQLLKQQQMMRLKESAAAAAAGGGNGLPPPPPLLPGCTLADSEAAVGAVANGTLPRTSSTASLGDDSMEIDQATQNGPAGLPPLGPGRSQRNVTGMAAVAATAAAALASRPGLFRPMVNRQGGLAGPAMVGGMGMIGLGMGAGVGGRGTLGMMGAGISPLGLPPRPPSPAGADTHNGGGPDDHPYYPIKRRRFSHPHGLDSAGDAANSTFAGGPLPGPPPRPPYSLVGGGHGHLHRFSDGTDGDVRVPHGPPALLHDLPPPPPHPCHYGFGRGGSEDRDPAYEVSERLSMEQLFALQRPLVRPPPLPPLQGRLQQERHVHGELTDAATLFALGLYGSYPPSANQAVEKAAPSKEKQLDSSDVEEKESCCMSPIIYPGGVPMSPLLEPPPPVPAVSSELLLPPPPPGSTPFDAPQLRPLRVPPTALAQGSVAGPSPFHQQGSPGLFGGWDSVHGTAGRGTGSTTSTPTVSGFGAAHGGFAPPASVPNSTAAASAALPPVVPISSLSDWRLPPTVPGAGPVAADGTAGLAGVPLPPMHRPSPHTSPDPHGAHASAAAAGTGRAGHSEETENIDEWLRPVSTHHVDVWDEPDTSFEAYVADMVRHRLGKYMQPEHPSRVSVQEAAMLRSKVYGEVVAKERRAWEERRRAGVYKPIERHKLEMNLKEFVRSTIKRMRDREKERAAAAGHATGRIAGHGHQLGTPVGGGHDHHHQSVRHAALTPTSVPYGSTPTPMPRAQSCEVGLQGSELPRPSPAPDPAGTPLGAQLEAAGGDADASHVRKMEASPLVAAGPAVAAPASDALGGTQAAECNGGSGNAGDVVMAEAIAA